MCTRTFVSALGEATGSMHAWVGPMKSFRSLSLNAILYFISSITPVHALFSAETKESVMCRQSIIICKLPHM